MNMQVEISKPELLLSRTAPIADSKHDHEWLSLGDSLIRGEFLMKTMAEEAARMGQEAAEGREESRGCSGESGMRLDGILGKVCSSSSHSLDLS